MNVELRIVVAGRLGLIAREPVDTDVTAPVQVALLLECLAAAIRDGQHHAALSGVDPPLVLEWVRRCAFCATEAPAPPVRGCVACERA